MITYHLFNTRRPNGLSCPSVLKQKKIPFYFFLDWKYMKQEAET